MAKRSRRDVLLAGVILAATVVVYLPSLRNGFIWDDDGYVTDNPTLRSWRGLGAIWTQPAASPQYYPMVFTTFWIEHQLWGSNPLGYHLVNVLLHACSSVILWRVLRRLGVRGAWLAGLIFAVHPVHVESVAWVTERKNVLSGLLYLASAAAYLRFEPPVGERRAWGYYVLAAVLFAGALLSKTVTCTLPAALLLVLWWKRPRLSLRDLWPLAPWLVIGAGMGLLTAWLEKVQVGAGGEDWAFSPAQRVLIAGQALWFYASKLVWPNSLAFIYPRWHIEQAAWWQYVFPASAAVVIVALVLWRRRVGKGAAVGVLYFAGTLFPALGFFNVYPMRFSFVADHFQYLASVGLIALGCSVLWRLGGRLAAAGRFGIGAAVAAGLALPVALGVLTWRQTTIYRSAESVWLDTLSKNPDCFLAHNNLGTIYFSQAVDDSVASRASLEKAALHCAAAARVRGDYPEVLQNLARVYIRLGRYTEAADLLQRALTLKPKLVTAGFEASLHFYLGLALGKTGRVEEAIDHYREAIRLDPHTGHAYSDLGALLMSMGRLREAEDLLRQAIAVEPDLFGARYNLGLVLEAGGDFRGAAESYQAALAIAPAHGPTYLRLAFVLAQMGRAEPAMAAFRESVRLDGPNEAAARALREILEGQTAATSQGAAP